MVSNGWVGLNEPDIFNCLHLYAVLAMERAGGSEEGRFSDASMRYPLHWEYESGTLFTYYGVWYQ
jgi:hypothetical protein